MKEWIYDDAGAIGPRIVVRIQVETDGEVKDDDIHAGLIAAIRCMLELGVGTLVHTPGPIPKWWKEESRG